MKKKKGRGGKQVWEGEEKGQDRKKNKPTPATLPLSHHSTHALDFFGGRTTSARGIV